MRRYSDLSRLRMCAARRMQPIQSGCILCSRLRLARDE